MPATADLLRINQDGSTRSSGWTFHDARDGIKPAKPVPSNNTPHARADILAAIATTSERHRRNQALSAAGLSTDEWRALFQAMIEAESAYNPQARSPVGAYGLGQLMPATAHALGVDRHDIAQNLDGAARYLLAQLATFKTVDLALAAYNAGPHRVVKYQGVPPFSETRTYIKRVNQIRSRLAGTPAPHTPIQIAQNPTSPWPALVLKLN